MISRRMRVMRALCALCGLLGGAATAGAAAAERDDLDPGAKLPIAESHVMATLPPVSARRLYVLDIAFPAAEASKTYIVDGDSGRLEGMFNQGYWPNFATAPDGAFLYAADTYFEKHTRGRRQDFLVVRDGRTLQVADDIPLPSGRLLVVSKKYNFGVTPDGRYGLSYNLAPRTAVSIVDLKERRYVGDIDVPGCGLIFPQAPGRFTTLCGDGSVATISFDDKLKTSTARLKKVFDAENDPVFEHSGWDKAAQKLYLLTYAGSVIPLDLSAAAPRKLAVWSLTTPAERAAGWKPGGWQISHMHPASKRLYVLMHRGHEWTEKTAGTEVWVFDTQTEQRVQRIVLDKPAQSIAVSQDAAPLLYTIVDDSDYVLTYEAASGRLHGRIDKLGFTPYLLTVPGE